MSEIKAGNPLINLVSEIRRAVLIGWTVRKRNKETWKFVPSVMVGVGGSILLEPWCKWKGLNTPFLHTVVSSLYSDFLWLLFKIKKTHTH